jgi:hypothetical protein
MHDEILNEFEGYLSGEPVSRAFTRHLESCSQCAGEVSEMQDVCSSLRFLRVEETEAVSPPMGFYSKVARTIEAEQASPVWGLFAPDLHFFRKIAFASLMLLAVLGSYLVSRESDLMASNQAQVQATLTEHNTAVPHESLADRQHIMVTLASFEQH